MLSGQKKLSYSLFPLLKSPFFCVIFILTKGRFKIIVVPDSLKVWMRVSTWNVKVLVSLLLSELCWFLFLYHFISASSEDLGKKNRTEIDCCVLSPHLCYSYPSFHRHLIRMHIQSAADNQWIWAEDVLRSAGRCRPLPLCCLLTAAWWKWGLC